MAKQVKLKAERRSVTLIRQGAVENPEIRRYLNRLSLLLFVLGRYEEKQAGHPARPAKAANPN